MAYPVRLEALTEADIGRKVVYTPLRLAFVDNESRTVVEGTSTIAHWVKWHERAETGILTSWNDKYVFVQFRGPGGEACQPEQCEFLGEARDER